MVVGVVVDANKRPGRARGYTTANQRPQNLDKSTLLSSTSVGPVVLRELLGFRDDDPDVRIEQRPKGGKGRTLPVYGRLCALLGGYGPLGANILGANIS